MNLSSVELIFHFKIFLTFIMKRKNYIPKFTDYKTEKNEIEGGKKN